MPAPFQQFARDCYAKRIGVAGADETAFAANMGRAGDALARIKRTLADDPRYGCLSSARHDEDLPGIADAAARLQAFRDIILIGTGGSALGARALQSVGVRSSGCRLHVLDNLQAGFLESFLERLDARQTGLLLISKSGTTVEVLSQALLVLHWLSAPLSREAIGRQVMGIAVPGESALRQLARAWDFPVLDHPIDIAGRYSVLSLVGMLPAAILGQDVRAIRAGAVTVLEDGAAAAVEGAALMATLHRQTTKIAVTMAYDERLELFTRWHAQLWAESLGKDGQGTTPVTALGPLDQHSQLQLYLDGPADKVFTILAVDSQGIGTPISSQMIEGLDGLSYLAGRSIGDIVSASARGTVETLIAHGRPVRLMLLPRVDEKTMGALFMHFMLETILTAELLGVDPFDQPAVDEGKVRAREYLKTGRVAFEP